MASSVRERSGHSHLARRGSEPEGARSRSVRGSALRRRRPRPGQEDVLLARASRPGRRRRAGSRGTTIRSALPSGRGTAPRRFASSSETLPGTPGPTARPSLLSSPAGAQTTTSLPSRANVVSAGTDGRPRQTIRFRSRLGSRKHQFAPDRLDVAARRKPRVHTVGKCPHVLTLENARQVRARMGRGAPRDRGRSKGLIPAQDDADHVAAGEAEARARPVRARAA